MLRKLLLIGAAAQVAVTPCTAAALDRLQEVGERRSGAVAGLYVSVPFNGPRNGKPQAGLRLRATHDYRNSMSRAAPLIEADALDLRLLGDKQPTLYLAGTPVTGDEGRKHNLLGGGGIVTVAVLALAVVGAFVIVNAVDDDDEECLDPNLCD